MTSKPAKFRSVAVGLLGVLWFTGASHAAEVRVTISGGLTAAYQTHGAERGGRG
ncbi:hypothetical protein [Bradyrhizobium sp. LB11.1]|uniref:hypothetical protein n=1 Tax=Bradyrhizobium sp. LB11.1 TaxID=3156326 RepID=UPI0033987681